MALKMSEDLDYGASPSKWSRRFEKDDQFLSEHYQITTEESQVVRRTVPCQLGIRYGKTRPHQQLDVFGTDLPKSAPIFVYVSGGYWQFGSGEISAYPVMPMYKKGIVSIIVDYDRAPGSMYDS